MRNELQEQLQKYKYMEASKRQSRRTYTQKIPEIKKALDVVTLLIEKRVSFFLFFAFDFCFVFGHQLVMRTED